MQKLTITVLLLSLLVMVKAQKNAGIESINAFSFKMFEKLYNEKDNCFYSAYSIFGSLSMTYAGAKENTKAEFENVLQIPQKDKILDELSDLSNGLGLEREITFISSNSIWMQKSLKPEKDYLKLVEEKCKAKVERTDFSTDDEREKSRTQINEWTEKQTKGYIKDFIPKGIIDQSTILILVNAVYFNALWDNEFLSDKTKNDIFWASVDDSVSCEMMNTAMEIKYYEDDKIQVAELPYQNSKASMLIFLPKEGLNVNHETFTYSYYEKIMEGLTGRNVNLFVPKFKLETSYELSECLQKMGLESAFTPSADFSGITGTKNLKLEKILHKSVIEVSEKGTEASSSTAILSTRSTKIYKEPAELKANHPFFFIIRHNPDKLILFMGYFTRPGKISNEVLKP